jgi:TolB-like protein/DNA-binding SARP family transcriptional activator
MLELRTLGSLDLTSSDGGQLDSVLAQPRRVALLCCLASGWPPAPHRRDTLLALFWPEHPTDQARHALRQAVYILRRELGSDAVVSHGDDALALDRGRVRCDAAEFERSLTEGRLEDALALYRGDLLPGFHIADAPEFERWLDDERARLRRLAGTAAWAVADARADARTADAADWALRAAAFSPGDESVLRRLIVTLDRLGDLGTALRTYDAFAAALEREYELQPSPETLALIDRVRARRAESRPVLENADAHATEPRPDTIAGAAESTDATPPEPPGPWSAPHQERPRWRRLAPFAALAVVVLIATVHAVRPDVQPTEPTAAHPEIAIAVLPFDNPGDDAEEQYFTDGLTDELTTALSGVRALRVAARTSAFAFKGAHRDIREIGRALNVSAVVEGSVRRQGGRVRVTARLINVSDGLHLWSSAYEGEAIDILEIQADLALRITTALAARLTPAERARLTRLPTENPEAYALYLKGRYFWNQRTETGYVRALDYLNRAVDADPRYAAAHAGLASVYSMLGLSGVLGPAEADARTKASALKALELDADLAEAHTALAGYLHVHDWDSENAEREHLRAIELDPNYATGRHWYANFLASMGRMDEAVAQLARAVELDPLAPVLSESLAHLLLRAGRAEDALERVHHALELDSTFWRAHTTLAEIHEAEGRYEEAGAAYVVALDHGGGTHARAGLARNLALAGDHARARRLLAELQSDATRAGVHTPDVASVLLILEGPTAAIAWLEQAVRERHPRLRFMHGLPGLHVLEQNPRYIELQRRIGLPPPRRRT